MHSIHIYTLHSVYLSFIVSLPPSPIPFCSLIPVRNIPQKVLFTQATYTRKHFIHHPSRATINPINIYIIYYPFGITFIAHFECASRGQIPMRMSFRSGFSDRVKEPKILDLRRYTYIVHTYIVIIGRRVLSVIR